MANPKSGGRAVAAVVPAVRTLEGEGFEVRRAIPGPGFQSVGPFIMLDHFGPTDYGPGEALGAPDHPHFGIETLTYMLEGFGLHRDSIGNVSITGPLEAQWMRAGRGIVHDEGADPEARAKGGRSHGIQLWINLPKGHRDAEPEYQAYRSDAIPELVGNNATIRLIAGALGTAKGPVTSFSPPWLAHVSLAPGATLDLDTPADIELGAYVLSGSGKAGTPVHEIHEGELVRFARAGAAVTLVAEGALDMLVLGGPPVVGQLLRYGPFVADTKQELLRAVTDYQTGVMGTIDFSKPIPARPQPRPAQRRPIHAQA